MAKDERGKEQKKWEVGIPRVNSSRLKVTRWWWELGEHDESQAQSIFAHLRIFAHLKVIQHS